MDGCVLGAENKTKIESMNREVTEMKISYAKDKKELFEIINEIKEKLLGRPSWLILFIMSAMSSALVGLAIILITIGINNGK